MTLRSYQVRTFGCQMNVHDSERLSGLLEAAGYVRADEGHQADVVVLNTCAVRENADNKLYGNLGHLAPVKKAHPGMQIAVGGCLAQKDRGEITRRAPWVDVVFGTHNIGSLPVLLERARHNATAQVEIVESLEVFPSTLPTRRESPYAAWVSISVGCNNTCTFCIVPSLRGTEKDRRPGDVLAEVEALVADGVLEVTLLGQNVNSYGVEFGDRLAFGKLLRACGEIDGLERVRFTSPHPKDFTDDVIAAMAETPNVMHSLHMPLQSGSDRVLKAMRRSYRQERYLGIIDRVRAAMPDAAITTDIIVGFPGETDDDFEQTLEVVAPGQVRRRLHLPVLQAARHAGRRAARPAAEGCRAGALRAAAWRCRRTSPGPRTRARSAGTVDVLVAEGEGRKDGATHRLSGRAPDNRLVHFAVPADAVPPRPGDVATVEVTYAAPHHLVADGSYGGVRATRAGDAWAARQAGGARAPGRAARHADGRRSRGPLGAGAAQPADVGLSRPTPRRLRRPATRARCRRRRSPRPTSRRCRRPSRRRRCRRRRRGRAGLVGVSAGDRGVVGPAPSGAPGGPDAGGAVAAAVGAALALRHRTAVAGRRRRGRCPGLHRLRRAARGSVGGARSAVASCGRRGARDPRARRRPGGPGSTPATRRSA